MKCCCNRKVNVSYIKRGGTVVPIKSDSDVVTVTFGWQDSNMQ